MAETVLTSRTPKAAGFQTSVAQHLRELAQRAREVRGDGVKAKQHQRALELLAEHVASLDADNDQHLASLYLAQALRGDGSADKGFAPGHKASRLIANLGLTPATPTPAEVLAELVRYSIEDLYSIIAETHKARADKEAREARRVAQDKAEQAIRRAQDSEHKQRAKVAELEPQLIEARKTIRYLKDRLPKDEVAPEPQPQLKRPRRKSVEGEPNLYATERADGTTVYEVHYRDQGKQHFTRIGPDIEEARRKRDELHGVAVGAEDEEPPKFPSTPWTDRGQGVAA